MSCCPRKKKTHQIVRENRKIFPNRQEDEKCLFACTYLIVSKREKMSPCLIVPEEDNTKCLLHMILVGCSQENGFDDAPSHFLV